MKHRRAVNVEPSTDDDLRRKIVKYIGDAHRSKKIVPTVAKLTAKCRVNRNKFYKLFPGRLVEACEAAQVPPPHARIEAVESAVAKRKQPRENDPVKDAPPSTPEKVDAGNTALKEVLDRESDAKKMEEALKLEQRRERAELKSAELKAQLQPFLDKAIANKICFDSAEYGREMRRYLEEHRNVQVRLTEQFNRLGYDKSDSENHKDAIISDQYKTANHLAVSLPETCTLMTPGNQWELIIEDLTTEADEDDYLHFEDTLKKIKPNLICLTHMTPLTHDGTYRFNCPHGEWLYLKCPKCQSPLNYDDTRFYCGACLRRFLGI